MQVRSLGWGGVMEALGGVPGMRHAVSWGFGAIGGETTMLVENRHPRGLRCLRLRAYQH